MKNIRLPCLPRLPLYLYGTYAVCGAGLVLAVVSAVQACRRPVTALTDIPMRSQTFVRETGEIIRKPSMPRYRATDIQPGDTILRYDGLSWEHAQRFNMHEVTNHTIGETIDLVVRRGERVISTHLEVQSSDLWEKLVLARFAIASLLCWIPSTFVLVTFTCNIIRQVRYQQSFPDSVVQMGNSGVPLWVLSWQGTGIALSMSGLKYPVAFLLAGILGQVLPMFIAVSSLPYPLAPRTRPLKIAEYALALVSVAIATTMFFAATHTLYQPPDGDWRRSVIVLNTIHDPSIQWTNGVVIASFAVAIIGIFTTAFSRQFITVLYRLHQHRAVLWLSRTYRDCPPALREITQFQLLIVVVYLMLDILPRSIQGTGSGYSVLFSLIPLSYLLLHSDIRARRYGRYLIVALTGAVVVIQLPHMIYRVATHTFALGGSWNDVATILVLSFGSMIGGALIAWNQWRRRRFLSDPLQEAIDGLFTIQTRDAFWKHVTKEVGKHLGVQTWLWLSKADGQTWQIIRQTPHIRESWLIHPEVQAVLESPYLSKPVDVTVDTSELPTSLIVLPVYRDEQHSEVWIVANPHAISDGVDLLENPLIHGRLRDALHALHGHERKQHYAEQEHHLAEQRRELAAAYQKLFRQQRSQSQASQTQISALLHDKSLQWLVDLKQTLSRLAQDQTLPPEQQQALDNTVSRCDAINDEIRRVIYTLRPRGYGQDVPSILEDVVSAWQRQYRTMIFKLRQSGQVPDLSEFQRNSVFLIVNQAVENAIKHGMPNMITITAREEDEPHHFVLEVQDDGRGFESEQVTSLSLGLLLMRELADEMGCRLDVVSQPGKGCRVQLEMPYDK